MSADRKLSFRGAFLGTFLGLVLLADCNRVEEPAPLPTPTPQVGVIPAPLTNLETTLPLSNTDFKEVIVPNELQQHLGSFKALVREYIHTDYDPEFWKNVFSLDSTSPDIANNFIVHSKDDGSQVIYYFRPNRGSLVNTQAQIIKNPKGLVTRVEFMLRVNEDGTMAALPANNPAYAGGFEPNIPKERWLGLIKVFNIPTETSDWQPYIITGEDGFQKQVAIFRELRTLHGDWHFQWVDKNGQVSFAIERSPLTID